jgi:hypothetical protein
MHDTRYAARREELRFNPIGDFGPEYGSTERIAAALRAGTRYYEQHVIACHALGPVSEARVAHAAIVRCRRKLEPEPQATSTHRCVLPAADLKRRGLVTTNTLGGGRRVHT